MTITKSPVDAIIVGQGIAGSTIAWSLHQQGFSCTLIDAGHDTTASKVSAGLITPITGRRYVKAADFQEHWDAATVFYPAIETLTGTAFFSTQQIVRRFKDEADRDTFLQKRLSKYEQEIILQSDADGTPTGFQMDGARLLVQRYLTATRQFFETKGGVISGDIAHDTDVTFDEDKVSLPRLGLHGRVLIWCVGSWQQNQAPFQQIPNSPCRGDILRVRIEGRDEQRVISQGVWLIPEPDGTYLAGSTYDWDDLRNEPHESGRRKILKQLQSFVAQPIEVLNHSAAVRPAMKNTRPVILQHHDHQRIAVLNGLGARGALWAPRQAAELVQQLIRSGTLPQG
jgi:glycine oxidase